MKKKLLFLIALMLLVKLSNAQVTVTGSNGADGNYSELRLAFNAINAQPNQAGRTIDIRLTANTTESASAVLNSGNWTRINIGLTTSIVVVSGNISGNGLMVFNGADNVFLNGYLFGAPTNRGLTLHNSSTSNLAATSTIRFTNDASNNDVHNSFIEGSHQAWSGVVLFDGAVSTGNDNNRIVANHIRGVGSNLPALGVYSVGASVTADNSGNILSGNYVYDFFGNNMGGTDAFSFGIALSAFNSEWRILENNIFQGVTMHSTHPRHNFRGIIINSPTGNNFEISNNLVGASDLFFGGHLTLTTTTTIDFIGIDIVAGNVVPSTIQLNAVSRIRLQAINSQTAPFNFTGIRIGEGAVVVGSQPINPLNNRVGHSPVQNEIIINTLGHGLNFWGVRAFSSGNVTIHITIVGAINVTGTAASTPINFIGVETEGTGNFTVTENRIGSPSQAHANTIGTDATTGNVIFHGIRNRATGNINISRNMVRNNTLTSATNAAHTGIDNQGGSGTVNITDNLIDRAEINNTGSMLGIRNSSAPSIINITGNIIHSQRNNSNTAWTTGIHQEGAVTGQININNNQLGNADGGFVNYPIASNGAVVGITNLAGGPSSALSILGNNIQGITHALAGSGAHTYINNTAANSSQTISNNTFTNLVANTTDSVTFIANGVALSATGLQTFDNNRIVGSFAKPAAGGTVALFNNNAIHAAGALVTHTNNNFSNITLTGATTMVGWSDRGLGHVARNINGNTFSNWIGLQGPLTVMNINGFGSPSTYLVSTSGFTFNSSVSNNTISNIEGNSTIFGIAIGSSGSADNLEINSNIIHNLRSTASIDGAIVAIHNENSSLQTNINSNTIHTLSSNTTTSSVIGIQDEGRGTTRNVMRNTIHGLQANMITSGSVLGISASPRNAMNIHRNKIYNLSSSSSIITNGTINGINLGGSIIGGNSTVANNLIGDLRATAGSGTNLIRGVALTATGANSTINLYHNTVFLSAPTTTGANLGSSGVFHQASTTSTTARLDMRNNIIVNTSEFKGTGTTVAFRRSAGSAGMLANFATTSNNNLFFAGTPGPSRLIYSDGVSSAQTILEYRNSVFEAGTIAPRDASSITNNLQWVSTLGSHIQFLQPNPLHSPFVESRGVFLSSITNDFAGNIRHGHPGYVGTGIAPDLGAFELEMSPSSIWSGSFSTVWQEVGNWLGGVLPLVSSSVVIPDVANQPILSNIATVNTLLVEAGASLELGASAQLTVSGTLTNHAGNAGLMLRSGASLVNFTTTVPATMERNFPGARAWRMVSSPVVNQTLAGTSWILTPRGDYDFFDWNEATSTWHNQKTIDSPITSFVPGRGYLVSYAPANHLATFAGMLNSGNITVPITHMHTGLHRGANLIGNPYASAIDWRLADRSLFIDNFAYVWDPLKAGGSGYITVDGNSANAFLAPTQGFFVLMDDYTNAVPPVRITNTTFTFTASMRSHGGSFRSAPVQEQMVFRLGQGQFFDETTIRIFKPSEWIRDRNDAAKFFSLSSEVPQLFSQSADMVQLAINSVPQVSQDSEFTLGLRAPATGQYSLSLQNTNGVFAQGDVFVRDLLTGAVHNLRQTPQFTFHATQGDHAARFKVSFTQPTNIGNLPQGTTAIYVYNNVLHLNFASDEGNRQMQVFDLSGRLVLGQRLSQGTTHSMPLNIEPGTYIVRITDSQGVTTQRVMVK